MNGIAEFTSEYALWGSMVLLLAVAIAWMRLLACGGNHTALLANASTVKAIMTAVPVAAALVVFIVGQVVAVRSQSGVLGMITAALAVGVAAASPSVGTRMVDGWAKAGADACVRSVKGRDWAFNESRLTLPYGVASVLQDPSLLAVATKAVGDTKGPEGYAHAVAVLVALGVSPASTFELCDVPAVRRTAAFTSLSPSAQERALSRLAGVLQTRPDRDSLIAAATGQLRGEAEAKAAAERKERSEEAAIKAAYDAQYQHAASAQGQPGQQQGQTSRERWAEIDKLQQKQSQAEHALFSAQQALERKVNEPIDTLPGEQPNAGAIQVRNEEIAKLTAEVKQREAAVDSIKAQVRAASGIH